jgi:hypothetical protein
VHVNDNMQKLQVVCIASDILNTWCVAWNTNDKWHFAYTIIYVSYVPKWMYLVKKINQKHQFFLCDSFYLYFGKDGVATTRSEKYNFA